jgi:uncharacterized membrane protein (DUF485 family)
VSPQELAPETEQPTEESFDWWCAPSAARERQEQWREREPEAVDQRDQTAADAAHMADSAGIAYAAEMPEIADFAESAKSAETVYANSADAEAPAAHGEAAIYRAVHESPEFREIRTRYRRFVFPATAVFLLWYLLYVVLTVSAPQLMTRPIAGPFNIAWLLGLLQFASTFLLAWMYARHARAHRDRAALGLRWGTQDRLR